VNEIKKDDDWKTKIAKEWNEAAEDDAANAATADYQNAYNPTKKTHDDTKS
jgi:hypothetical protein